MIARIQYGGAKKEIKDGKEIRIPIHPQSALQGKGPIIQITITQPRSIAEKLKELGEEVPSVQVKGLIDTGAFGCIITPEVAEKLKLVQTGFQKVTSVQDEQDRPSYYAYFQFPWGIGKEVAVAACPLTGYDCLIGRDILRHWYLTYDGHSGMVVICD